MRKNSQLNGQIMKSGIYFLVVRSFKLNFTTSIYLFLYGIRTFIYVSKKYYTFVCRSLCNSTYGSILNIHRVYLQRLFRKKPFSAEFNVEEPPFSGSADGSAKDQLSRCLRQRAESHCTTKNVLVWERSRLECQCCLTVQMPFLFRTSHAIECL